MSGVKFDRHLSAGQVRALGHRRLYPHTQRRILELLEIQSPWPEQDR